MKSPLLKHILICLLAGWIVVVTAFLGVGPIFKLLDTHHPIWAFAYGFSYIMIIAAVASHYHEKYD